ncbi:phospholipase D family nuclease [Herminiimonas arsenitoxidans]|uniref:phospholipase D family nuclease n=1 Tax=Herminiimonas arsenitoxidans TaxID=1809410 RepID=UPI0009708824|nr:phospholipase D family protein [Herminiimonas arsenitoxidans]
MNSKVIKAALLIAFIGSSAFATASNISAAPAVENAFSPKQGAEQLVLRQIVSADRTLRVAAYSFTSPVIVKALLAAKKRGVDVKVVVDEQGNKGKANIAALNLLVNGGIPTRTVSAYAIHHDKYIIADNRHVQTGSFNYSQAAAKSNSENVIVVWNNQELATSYSKHWLSRWNQGKTFRSSY